MRRWGLAHAAGMKWWWTPGGEVWGIAALGKFFRRTRCDKLTEVAIRGVVGFCRRRGARVQALRTKDTSETVRITW